MYKNIFQVFTFYFYNVTPMEKHLWNWTQIIQNHFFLCVCQLDHIKRGVLYFGYEFNKVQKRDKMYLYKIKIK